MKRIAVVLPINEEEKQRFQELAPQFEFLFCEPDKIAEEEWETLSAVIGNVEPELLAKIPNLEWVQLNSAGTDGYLSEGVLPRNAVLTNATGAYGVAIAEHMMGMLLVLQKKLDLYLRNQENSLWRDEGDVRPIYGTTTMIVGLGDIGKEFAKRMKAFGSYILGIRRTVHGKPEEVDEIYTIDELSEQLKRADIVAICLPGTKETYHLFSKELLKKMKPGAVLLNVGRGNVIDTQALTELMKESFLGGVALDVTEPEPLLEMCELWAMPNVLITPHVAGGFHLRHTLERIIEISQKNLKAYADKGVFSSVVDRETGYKKSGMK